MLLGAGLFGASAALNVGDNSPQGEILVTTGHIENLAASFRKLWHRNPTETELKGLIDDYVKEEVLSREAITLGLDQNDTVIRRRLQQKMAFLAEDFVAASEPTEAELVEFLAKYPERFAVEQQFTFRQVLFDPQKHGDRLAAAMDAMLADLTSRGSEVDLSALGDGQLLPNEFRDEPQYSVSAQFGPEFAAELARLKTGEWTSGIRSGYGLHLVYLASRTEGRVPALEEVREVVKRELMNERRAETSEQYLNSLLAKYRVTVETPQPVPDAAVPVLLQ
jgi:hypothetical protein